MFATFVWISILLQSSLVLSSKTNISTSNVTCEIKVEYIESSDSNEYKVSCHQANTTKIGCCAIIQKYPIDGLHYEWGKDCNLRKNNLKDYVNVLEFREPTETTCKFKLSLIKRSNCKFDNLVFPSLKSLVAHPFGRV